MLLLLFLLLRVLCPETTAAATAPEATAARGDGGSLRTCATPIWPLWMLLLPSLSPIKNRCAQANRIAVHDNAATHERINTIGFLLLDGDFAIGLERCVRLDGRTIVVVVVVVVLAANVVVWQKITKK